MVGIRGQMAALAFTTGVPRLRRVYEDGILHSFGKWGKLHRIFNVTSWQVYDSFSRGNVLNSGIDKNPRNITQVLAKYAPVLKRFFPRT